MTTKNYFRICLTWCLVKILYDSVKLTIYYPKMSYDEISNDIDMIGIFFYLSIMFGLCLFFDRAKK